MLYYRKYLEPEKRPDWSSPANTKRELDAGELQVALDHARAALATQKKKGKELASVKQNVDDVSGVEEGLAQDPFYLSLTFILPRETDTRSALKNLQQFKTTMKKVNTPLEVGRVDFVSNMVTTAKLSITKLPDLPDDQKPGRAVSEYSFEFRPYSTVRLGVGGAVVYSFVKTHKFEATQLSSGGFQIIDTQQNDHVGTKVAAMLTILPRALAASDLHPVFELGVTPDTNIGIFGGLGIQFTDIFSFGAGIAFSQVDELTNGQHLGQVLTSAGDLKTHKHFESGVYFHFTAAAKVKN